MEENREVINIIKFGEEFFNMHQKLFREKKTFYMITIANTMKMGYRLRVCRKWFLISTM